MVDGPGEGGPGTGHRGHREAEPFPGQVGGQPDEPGALLAEPVGHRHPDVGEHELGGVLGVQTHLPQLAAALEAGHAALEHQQRQPPVRVVAGADRGDDQVGVDAVGDERLGAVDDVVVTLAHGPGGDAGQVGAGAGLGHRDGGDGLAGHHAGEPAALLVVVGELGEVRRDHVGLQGRAEERRRDADGLGLLGEDRVEPEVRGAVSAVLLVDVEPEGPELAEPEEQLARDDPGVAPRLEVGHDVALEQRSDAGAVGLVLGPVEVAAHVRRSSRRRRPGSAR